MIKQPLRLLLGVLILTLVPPSASSQLSNAATTGIIIPLYISPGSIWDTVVEAKKAYPVVPIVAIINPNNGPGNATNTNYVTGIQKLQSSGIVVLGYVHTNYTSRSSIDVMTDIDNYKNWYNVNGAFFDEMSNVAGGESYYRNLNDYAKSKGFTFTVGNAGIDIVASYIGTVDNIIIYDNKGLPSITFLGGWYTDYDKNNFSFVSYGVNTLDRTFVSHASNHVGFLYVTDGLMPNPWSSLPPYFSDLLASIQVPLSLTIKSVESSDLQIDGLWTEIYSNGTRVKTGFTPQSYGLTPAIQYNVCVGDYQNYVFDHWENGNTDRCNTITPTQDTTLTAHYKTYSTLTVPSPPQNLQATAGFKNITLSWQPPSSDGGSPVTNYRILRSTSSGTETFLTKIGDVTSYTNTGLANGVTYFYKVKAVNSVDPYGSSFSNEASAITLNTPSPPQNLQATAGTGNITLSWQPPSSDGGSPVTNYRIFRSTSSGTETFLTKIGDVTSYTNTGLANGVTYFYKVKAVNAVDSFGSSFSNEASATTLNAPSVL